MSPEALDATVEVMEKQIGNYEVAVRSLSASIRELQDKIDALRLEHRPTYPTEAQRKGIERGLELITAGVKAKSHLGDPCGPEDELYAVSYRYGPGFVQANIAGNGGVLYVNDRAPRSRRNGNKLWSFTDDDLAAIFLEIENHGFHVSQFWTHGEGVSIVVAPK